MSRELQGSPLGKESSYVCHYDPALLCPIPRKDNRVQIGISADLPFYGVDIWNAYEVSWLNLSGKPFIAIATFSIPCDSPNIIESKSFKLYLNSFNQTRIDSVNALQDLMQRDLTAAAGAEVTVILQSFDDVALSSIHRPEGECIDGLEVLIDQYDTNSDLLQAQPVQVEERLYTHLLKSNCPVTGQPDWGTLLIQYRGNKLCRESLLKYVVSFRQHSDFHEHCVERIFMDILRVSKANVLEVSARYVRRGGLDINPCRSLAEKSFDNQRLANQ